MSTFYALPIHYQGPRGIYSVEGATRVITPEVNDNDYRTYSESSVFIAQTFGDSATENTRVDSIFIKCSGVNRYSVSVPTGMGTGTGFTDRTIPANVTTFEGISTPTTIGDFQNDLVDLTALDTDGTINAREIQVEFSGVNIRIYDMMFLRKLMSMDVSRSFRSVAHNHRDNSLLKRNIRGASFRVSSLSSRPKWESSYTALFNEFSPTSYHTFSAFVQDNRNFVFAPEYTRYPDRVYPATWGSDNFNNSYLTRVYRSGTLVSYVIRET